VALQIVFTANTVRNRRACAALVDQHSDVFYRRRIPQQRQRVEMVVPNAEVICLASEAYPNHNKPIPCSEMYMLEANSRLVRANCSGHKETDGPIHSHHIALLLHTLRI